MTSASLPESRRRLSKSRLSFSSWWAAAVVLLLIGAAFLTVGRLGHPNTLPAPAAAPQSASPPSAAHGPPTSSSTPTTPKTANPPAALARSVPVALRIPAIGISVSLGTLGLNPDRTVEVPTNYQQPGWYRLGPTPGQVGSAVILGHVDDKSGPAVFYKLPTLRAGDKVDVSLADGAVAHFAVKTVESYLKTQFPSRKVYASHGYSGLQLVTCGGAFDTRTGHYLSNVVAYTTLVSTTPPERNNPVH